MSKHVSTEIRVVPRNLRWEVSLNSVTRPMIDWLCTKDRAIDHAFERAYELLRVEPHAQVFVIIERADRSEEQRTFVDSRQKAAS